MIPANGWRAGAFVTILLSLLLVVLGLIGIVVVGPFARPAGASMPAWVLGSQAIVFLGTAGFLARRREDDDRIAALAAIFALIAAAFARRPVEHLLSAGGTNEAANLLRGLRVDAFLPYFVWRFFDDFPRSIRSRRITMIGRLGRRVALLIGWVLLAANLWSELRPESISFASMLRALSARGAYWTLVYALVAAAIAFAIWKSNQAPTEERRRARLFTAALGVSALPICAFVLAEGSSRTVAAWLDSGGDVFVLPIVEFLILLIPISTGYAVTVGRVLPVGMVIRQAVAYWFARSLLAVAAIAPAVWILWAALLLRDESLAAVLRGPRLAIAAISLGAALGAVRFRIPVKDAIDRAFFRDAYDSRRLLLSIAAKSQASSGGPEWAASLAEDLDTALHVHRPTVLVRDDATGRLVARSGHCRSLPTESGVARELLHARRPINGDLYRDPATPGTLDEADRHWLTDGEFEVLVPVISSEDTLLAILALGPKRSELPFTSEDQTLLEALATSISIPLERDLRNVLRASRDHESDELAWQCPDCGRVQPYDLGCARCGAELERAALPFMPMGRLRLEERIGVGGMGTVYKATDLALHRTVALKTLNARSPEDASRLRREARAMAAVESAHLARIYSVETWMGSPLLITEFMAKGMLNDRIGSPLGLDELAPLGRDLSLATRDLHESGILHRDIKPSNIGFASDGAARLIDFGLALFVAHPPSPAEVDGDELHDRDALLTTQRVGGLCGTPLYLSPESLRGDPLDVSSDLWALAVVLCELYLGEHPFERGTWFATQRAISAGWQSELSAPLAGRHEGLDAFFDETLAASIHDRPTSSSEFHSQWVVATAAS